MSVCMRVGERRGFQCADVRAAARLMCRGVGWVVLSLEPVKTKPERDSSFLVRRWIARQPLSTPNFSSAMEDRHVDAANRATCRE